jgi:hypothetical protein
VRSHPAPARTAAAAAALTRGRVVYVHGPYNVRAAARGDGVESPRNWVNTVDRVAELLTGRGFAYSRPWHALAPGAVFVSISPTLRSFPAAWLGRPMLYLCWGVPPLAGPAWARRLKLWRLRFVLSRASLLLVNDPETAADIRRLVGRPTTAVPYVVDTDYFAFAERGAAAGAAAPFMLVPGDSDRDEEMVAAAAGGDVRVVRVTRSAAIRDWYARRLPPGVTVEHDVPFPRLRELYRTAAAVALPIRAENHVAGQTALLEAIACGAPVMTNGPRLLGALRSWGMDHHTSFADAGELRARFREARDGGAALAPVLRRAAGRLAATNHPDRVAQAIVELATSAGVVAAQASVTQAGAGPPRTIHP